MGINFYIIDINKSNAPRIHVGKRRAAGYYCFDCHVTLHQKGESSVYSTEGWLNFCPKCGKLPGHEDFEQSSIGRALGHNVKNEEKTGIKSCSSFSWDIYPFVFDTMFKTNANLRIVDEYYRKDNPESRIYTYSQFKKEALLGCPIWEFGVIGMNFT